MSEKWLKGIFLIFGFCFFLQVIWMLGANFGLAEPFCVVVGKNSLRCSKEGEIRAIAKQFCLGKAPFGEKYRQDKSKQLESLVPPFVPAPVSQDSGQGQGVITQEQWNAQQAQFLQQQQQLQAQRQVVQEDDSDEE